MRKYISVEFKGETANLVIEQGYSHKKAANAVDDVSVASIARWIKQLKAELGGYNTTSSSYYS